MLKRREKEFQSIFLLGTRDATICGMTLRYINIKIIEFQLHNITLFKENTRCFQYKHLLINYAMGKISILCSK
jgi:hypothetical protein